MVLDEQGNHESNSNSENLLKFRPVFSFFIKYMMDRTDIIISLIGNRRKQMPNETSSVSSSLFSTSSISPSPKARHKTRQPTLLFSTKSDNSHAPPCSKSPYFSIQSNLSAGNVAPPNVSVPEYPSPLIPWTRAALIKQLSFLSLRASPNQNWPSILSFSFPFHPITTKLTKSNLHWTGYADCAFESLSSSCNTSTNLSGLNPRVPGPVLFSKNILNFKSTNFS